MSGRKRSGDYAGVTMRDCAAVARDVEEEHYVRLKVGFQLTGVTQKGPQGAWYVTAHWKDGGKVSERPVAQRLWPSTTYRSLEACILQLLHEADAFLTQINTENMEARRGT